jgi:putative membrane protein
MNIPPQRPSWGVRLIARTLAAFGTAWLLPGVDLDQFTTAIWLSVVLALLNSTIKPLLVIFTIPLTVVTFGLFLLVINAGVVLLASDWVDGFTVGGFWSALAFSVVYSALSSTLEGQWKVRVQGARRD